MQNPLTPACLKQHGQHFIKHTAYIMRKKAGKCTLHVCACREELKQQMAVTASKLLQNPEANLPSMRSLLTLAADSDTQASLLFFEIYSTF